MNKVVINTCYGGYGLSAKANAAIYALKHPGEEVFFYMKREHINFKWRCIRCSASDADFVLDTDFGDSFIHDSMKKSEPNMWEHRICYNKLPRHDKDLVAVVEQLGDDASDSMASLEVVEIDSDMYRIDEYDGEETVITPEDDVRRYVKIN